MSQPRDTYGLYKTPSIATIGAYVSVVVAIFFSAYVMSMRSGLQVDAKRQEDELQVAHDKIDELQVQVRSLERALVLNRRIATPFAPPVIDTPSPTAATAPTEESVAIEETSSAIRPMSAPSGVLDTVAMPELEADSIQLPSSTQGAPDLAALEEDLETISNNDAAMADTADEHPVEPQVVAEADDSLSDALIDPFATAPEPTLDEAAELVGEVLAYNEEKESVMVNLGRNRGATADRRLTLWRGKTYLGEVRIQKVFATISACEVLNLLPDGVRVGDTAKSAANASASM